jgi:hypothetical protein
VHATSKGGGIFQVDNASYYAPVIRGSILAGNTAGGGAADFKPDSHKTPIVNFSLIGVADGLAFAGDVGNLTGTAALSLDPLLSPLADNGGPSLPDGVKVLTHALLPGSPAIGAGDPAAVAGAGDIPAFDQRGVRWSRVFGGRIDIGAVEAQPNPLPGDANFNGSVDNEDFTIWEGTFGSTTDLRADFNGDGVVDAADYTVWRDSLGSTLAMAAAISRSPTTLKSESVGASLDNSLAVPQEIFGGSETTGFSTHLHADEPLALSTKANFHMALSAVRLSPAAVDELLLITPATHLRMSNFNPDSLEHFSDRATITDSDVARSAVDAAFCAGFEMDLVNVANQMSILSRTNGGRA